MDDEPCDICQRTETRIEDGSIVCAHCGNFRGPAPFAAGDEGEYPEGGTIVRRKEQKVKQKASKIYRGRKGYRLFLQAWQHILWRQCYAAVHTCGLPPELWNVVKDLWELRLTELTHLFTDETKDKKDPTLADTSDSASESAVSASKDEEAKDHLKASRKLSNTPRLIDTVALLYLGALLLRLPLSLATLFDWISNDTILFTRPIRFVPTDIKKHLASEHDRALDTISIPRPADLQHAVLRTATMYTTTFGMIVPPLNFLLLLRSHVEQLALPLQVYMVAKHLSTIIGYDFTYPTDRNSRRMATTYPESQLMSLVVVATKLLYPFDSESAKTNPRSLNEPTALRLDWSKWLTAKKHHEERISNSLDGSLRPARHIQVNDVDVMDMNEKQLDGYMDWYQEIFARVKDRDEQNLSKNILEAFPVNELSEPSIESKTEQYRQQEALFESLKIERLRAVLGGLTTAEAISDDDDLTHSTVLRPGERYQRFKDASVLSGTAKAFHQEAADMACLTLDQLLRAVNHTEVLIEKWKREQHRKEVWPDAMDVEAVEGAELED